MKLILYFMIFNFNTSNNTEIIILKSNNCCINCFQDIKMEFETKKFTNFKLLICKQNGFLPNYESKQKMSTIFQNIKIEFLDYKEYCNIKTPAVLILTKTKLNTIDTLLIPYEELFKNGKLNANKLDCIH